MKRRLYTRWDSERDASLKLLWADPGISASEIAERLGTTTLSIHSRKHKLGLGGKPRAVRVPAVIDDMGESLLLMPGTGSQIPFLIEKRDWGLVDDGATKWFPHKEGDRYYVYGFRPGCGMRKLHRIIMQAGTSDIIDHKNGDTLDNRRCNLRFATHQQNTWNGKRKFSPGYKGVWLHKHSGLWTGTIKESDGHRQSIGYFHDPKEAAHARDALAKLIQGEFAYLNFPDEPRAA